ncbi:hypothetical protein [Methanolacinia paynteri]|uniref:hypothetical protein n=1 Tax=Methanolacinia paynteri TaxID=230356 RepID=UPI00064FC13F|nr:hypothetical protein [Methanolacinia paynteri]
MSNKEKYIKMIMTHIERLGNSFEIELHPDEKGYIGRECPNPECEGYFKIVLGTGLKGTAKCYCPYCGYSGDQSEFFTKDQIEFATSKVIREFTDALVKDLKSLEFDNKSKESFGIGLSLKVEPGKPYPIHHYRERELETFIECPECTLKYSVYGLFAFCPDCGQHNSIQILQKNLEIAEKMVELANSVEDSLKEKLVENALEDCISAFDGFGREICKINAEKSSSPEKVWRIHFQNLNSVRDNINDYFGIDITQNLSDDEWNNAEICFQKRHLLAHKMGIIDKDYVKKTGVPPSMIGHKITVTLEDIKSLIPIIEKLANSIKSSLDDLTQ